MALLSKRLFPVIRAILDAPEPWIPSGGMDASHVAELVELGWCESCYSDAEGGFVSLTDDGAFTLGVWFNPDSKEGRRGWVRSVSTRARATGEEASEKADAGPPEIVGPYPRVFLGTSSVWHAHRGWAEGACPVCKGLTMPEAYYCLWCDSKGVEGKPPSRPRTARQMQQARWAAEKRERLRAERRKAEKARRKRKAVPEMQAVQ